MGNAVIIISHTHSGSCQSVREADLPRSSGTSAAERGSLITLQLSFRVRLQEAASFEIRSRSFFSSEQ